MVKVTLLFVSGNIARVYYNHNYYTVAYSQLIYRDYSYWVFPEQMQRET